jgi:hypothetical protein
MNEKLKNVLHYIIWNCQCNFLKVGATQLAKIVIYSDVLAFMERCKSISDAQFIKKQFGPVPNGFEEAIKELELENKISVRHQSKKYESTCYACLINPDPLNLGEDEKLILNSLSQQICNEYSATLISELSHNKYWEMAELSEEIPLMCYVPHETVFLPPSELEQEEKELDRELKKFEESGFVNG